MENKKAPNDTEVSNGTIKVICVEPRKNAYVKRIENSLESLQHEVGGYIEAVHPFEDPVAIICNDEGKMTGEPLNRGIRGENGELYDVIAGTFIIAGISDDDFSSLPDGMINKYLRLFFNPEVFFMCDGKIMSETYKP